MKKMNMSQFTAIAKSKYIKLKEERTQAVKDVIFNGSSARAAEVKYSLCSGVIKRDVNRINDFYIACMKVTKSK